MLKELLEEAAVKLKKHLVQRAKNGQPHRFSVLETSTGGQIAQTFTSLTGASEHFLDGRIIYDQEAQKQFLDVKSFEQKIVNDYNSNGYFENAYGRRITSINAPVNYYIQSTAADYACILYEQLMNKLPESGINLIGSIHDAIILDCQKDKIGEVMAVNSLTEKILNITSYFKVVRHS